MNIWRAVPEIQPVFEVGNTELICRMLEKNASAISLLPDYVTEKAVQEKDWCGWM